MHVQDNQNLWNTILELNLKVRKLKKIISNNYITIKDFNNLSGINISNNYKYTLNTLFFANNLPQMWIIDSIQYQSKNSERKIVYVYVLSHAVKNFCVKKLKKHVFNYCNNWVTIS